MAYYSLFEAFGSKEDSGEDVMADMASAGMLHSGISAVKASSSSFSSSSSSSSSSAMGAAASSPSSRYESKEMREIRKKREEEKAQEAAMGEWLEIKSQKIPKPPLNPTGSVPVNGGSSGDPQTPQVPPDSVIPPPAQDGAKKRPGADPEDPNRRKRPRNRYSQEQKQMIIDADAQGGRQMRHKVAALMGMPSRTADQLINRFRHPEKGDHALEDNRKTNRGRTPKKEQWMLDLLVEWLHFDATLTNKQLHEYINREILRRILIENGIALSDEEKPVGSPLEMKRYLENEEVKALYEARFIKSGRTIGKWLDGMTYTRKHIIKEKTTVSSYETKKKQLIYAKSAQV